MKQLSELQVRLSEIEELLFPEITDAGKLHFPDYNPFTMDRLMFYSIT